MARKAQEKLQQAIELQHKGNEERRQAAECEQLTTQERGDAVEHERKAEEEEAKVETVYRFLPCVVGGRRLLIEEVNTGSDGLRAFRVDAKTDDGGTDGIAYRCSPDLDDRDAQRLGPMTGDLIHGTEENDWLRVLCKCQEPVIQEGQIPETERFLPILVGSRRVLIEEASSEGDGLQIFRVDAKSDCGERDGIAYRFSRNIEDRDAQLLGPVTGDHIHGIEEDGWVRVTVDMSRVVRTHQTADTTAPKAGTIALDFDGAWLTKRGNNVRIEGDMAIFAANGATHKFVAKNDTDCTLTFGDVTHSGTKSNNTLTWDDGDVWTRNQ